MSGAGDSLGESPRGDLTRCVPNVAPPLVLREAEPGVLGLFGVENGPATVGVIARVVAAMSCEYLVGRLCEDDLERVSVLEEVNEHGLERTRKNLSLADALLLAGRKDVVWL